jgi:UDP-N-acetylmuramoyl-L-alanyl-D-glutamate--2,6-diaminopimelate ligase
MKFTELLQIIPEAGEYGKQLAGIEIKGVACDSSKVKPGFVFIAIKGEKTDGTQFIPQAEAAGAVVAICGNAQPPECRIPVIRLDNPRFVLAKIAAAFYGTQPENIVAVTGTDGKTSTADFFRQFMHLSGEKSASMGTLGVISGDGKNLYPGTLTTPDPIELHRILSELEHENINNIAMEASSHGLSQYRLDGVSLQAAAFTNIARDHLDYHKNEEAYFLAKSRLYSELLPEGKTAVLNRDDKKFPLLEEICRRRKHKVIGFGRNGGEFCINSITPGQYGQNASLTLFGKKYEVEVPLVGEFQVMNILAALGLVVGAGGQLEQALANIIHLKGVAGRLEKVATSKKGASIFIDYAHTPLALANILNTLRPHTKGKLHVVFGCGGDRDGGKRPQMGKIASELADYVIITDDNPRSENPEVIRAAIMEGITDRKKCKEVEGRKEAIYLAVKKLSATDTLVIAGKGHEKMQIIGNRYFEFDDGEVARMAVNSLRGRA